MTGGTVAGTGDDREDELAALRRSDAVLREELRDARSLVVQSQRELERARAVLDLVRADAARLREHIATICC
jgi:hypothetical protein